MGKAERQLKSHIRLSDGSLWPCPMDAGETEWTLRHADMGSIKRSDLLKAASILDAYRRMIMQFTQKKVCLVRREIKALVESEERK